MAHGLGWYLAQEEMAARKALLEADDTVVCPLCGEAMKWGGVAWFCYSDPETEKCPKLPALARAFIERATDEEKRRGFDLDRFQGQLVGGVVHPAKGILVRLETTRGGGGWTNLRVSAGTGVSDKEVPAIIRESVWMFIGWAQGIS